MLARLRMADSHLAAAHAAGIGELIIEPHLQPLLLCQLHNPPADRKPFIRQIRNRHPLPGAEYKSPQPLILHLQNLFLYLLLFDLPVQKPKRTYPVFLWRIIKIGYHIKEILLPGRTLPMFTAIP